MTAVPAPALDEAAGAIPSWVTLVFAAAVVVAYTFSLAFGALAEPDEARYAEIAREMLVRHDWVTPTLNFVKYFEKPPLVYWLTMLTFTIFGITDWVARVVPVASALLTLALTWIIARRIYDRWATLVGVVVLATSPLFFALGQTLTLDATLMACLTATLVCFWFGYHDAARRPRFYRLMYVAVALGVLTKGPVAVVLSGGIVVAFLITQRDWRAIVPLLDPIGIGLFALVALPWFVLVSTRNSEFLNFFIMDQHVKRFVSPDEHQESRWFFLPFVVLGLMPWSLALALLPHRWRALPRVTTWSDGTWFCVLWASVVIGFFSLSASKLITYILPAFPPLALLTARALQVALAEDVPLGRRMGMVFTYLGWIMVIGGGVAALLHADPIVPRILPSLGVGGVVMVVAGGLARRAPTPQRALVAVAVGWSLLLCAAIAGRDVTNSYRGLARVIHAHAGPDDQIVIYHHYVQGMPFYTERRVVQVGGRGELTFGSEQGDQRAFFWREDDRLLQAWASPIRLFLVINRTELETLKPQLVSPPTEIAAEGKKVVVVNHPLS
ncbi:MAG: glycosyltransferase family 39 protein [Deltaproteobacteria bacterium]|nr:glycosyltransferase family 39 protein [Deltaproteobacteria bacterium]MBI3387494.1 glycosyltransferase family 39 protein [Deltaproteobacteria bacterium]